MQSNAIQVAVSADSYPLLIKQFRIRRSQRRRIALHMALHPSYR